jgi:hypothetical protein
MTGAPRAARVTEEEAKEEEHGDTHLLRGHVAYDTASERRSGDGGTSKSPLYLFVSHTAIDTMMKTILALFALFASAAAFVPAHQAAGT